MRARCRAAGRSAASPRPPPRRSPHRPRRASPRTCRARPTASRLLRSGRVAQAPSRWTRVAVPSVFNPTAVAGEYAGSVRRYRMSFRGPRTPRGFRWALQFESVRRAATVFLNGRRLGRNTDPYTPFSFEARGLRPGRANELLVIVDSRKDPRLPEGWWNWGGIVRPVSLVPLGRAHLHELGTMSRVKCRGPARACRAELLIEGLLEQTSAGRPRLEVALRAPSGRRIRRSLRLPARRPWTPPGERGDAGARAAALEARGSQALRRPPDPARCAGRCSRWSGARWVCARSRSSAAGCSSTTARSSWPEHRSTRTCRAAARR